MRVQQRFGIRVGRRPWLLLTLVAGWGGCTGSLSDDGAPGQVVATGGSTNGISSGGSAGQGPVTPPPLPPEQEKENSFKLPVQSGRWVWSANPDSGRVAMIDARSLRVELASAGFAPTYLASLPVAAGSEVTSAAIVLNAKSNDASLLRRGESTIDVATVPTHTGANSWAISSSGRWALAWSDASLVKDADPADSFQDITLIDTAAEPPRATRLSVGYRPNRIFFQDDEARAFVVSEPGITILELADSGPSVSHDVALSEIASEKPVDVSVVPSGRSAFFRVEGSPRLGIVRLPSGERTDVTLSGPITDLDLVADGSSAIAVVRGQPLHVSSGGMSGSAGGVAAGGSSGGATDGGRVAGVSGGGTGDAGGVESDSGSGGGGVAGAGGSAGGAFAQGGDDSGEAGEGFGAGGHVGGSGSGYGPSQVALLELERVLENPTAFDSLLLADLVGSVAVSSDGSRAVLFSTATALDRITLLNTDPGAGDYLQARALRVRAPVDAVFIAPDTTHALVALRAAASGAIGGAFGIVPLLAPLGVKIQSTDAPITGVAFAPAPTTSAILTAATGKTAYLVHLPALRVDLVALPSLPLAAGIIADEKVGYVAQKHPGGRLSLVNLESGETRMLTGFELAGAINDGN